MVVVVMVVEVVVVAVMMIRDGEWTQAAPRGWCVFRQLY